MGIRTAVKQILVRQQDKKYEAELSRLRVTYEQWASEQEAARSVLPPVEVSTEFVIIRQRKGRLAVNAEERICAFFGRHPEVEILYGDEDLWAAGAERTTPWYKPCWSPDTYRSQFYPGSVIAVRRPLWEKAGEDTAQEILFDTAGEMRVLFDRLFFTAGGFHRDCHSIAHMEEILFHGEWTGAGEENPWEEYQTAGESDWLRGELKKQAEYIPTQHKVSVIIPSKDNPKVLKKCLESLTKRPKGGIPMEILLVDNGSSEENRRYIEKLLEKVKPRTAGIQYLYEPAEFNFSAMCNLGAEQADGDLLLFLNDDIEVCENDWLERMAERALQPYVGSVGLKLYYPDSVKIQHDGIVNLPVGPVHKLQFMEDDRSYYFGRNRFTCDCIAVTGACLLLRSEVFRDAGGFREELRVAYNDVELGFRLVEMGYCNVVLNDRYAYHHESLSRGSDESPEKGKRLKEERELLYQMHPEFRGEDPYYPVGLNREGLDSRIVPAYVTDRNILQEPAWNSADRQKMLRGARQDDCLMARVETAGPERIQGYSVILGDDNACYEKYLLLLPCAAEDDVAAQTGQSIWHMQLQPAYRQELEENLPDQKNVALGGFCVKRAGEKLPAGDYVIAVLAVNRVSGLRLWNTTGKYLTEEKHV